MASAHGSVAAKGKAERNVIFPDFRCSRSSTKEKKKSLNRLPLQQQQQQSQTLYPQHQQSS